MSNGPSSMSRAFQTFLERAPKHAGAWMTTVHAALSALIDTPSPGRLA